MTWKAGILEKKVVNGVFNAYHILENLKFSNFLRLPLPRSILRPMVSSDCPMEVMRTGYGRFSAWALREYWCLKFVVERVLAPEVYAA